MSDFSSFWPIRDRWKVRYRRACIICLKREDKEAKPSLWKHPIKSEMPIHQPTWIFDMYSFNSPFLQKFWRRCLWIKTSLRSLDLNRWWICRIERSLWNRINCLGDRPLACCFVWRKRVGLVLSLLRKIRISQRVLFRCGVTNNSRLSRGRTGSRIHRMTSFCLENIATIYSVLHSWNE